MNAEYECPDNYITEDFLRFHSYDYHFSTYATYDDAICALKDVGKLTYRQSACQRSNGKTKEWITFVYGFGTFEFTKTVHRAVPPGYSSVTTDTETGTTDYSYVFYSWGYPREQELEFSVKAICFKVRRVETIYVKLLRHSIHTTVPVSVG